MICSMAEKLRADGVGLDRCERPRVWCLDSSPSEWKWVFACSAGGIEYSLCVSCGRGRLTPGEAEASVPYLQSQIDDLPRGRFKYDEDIYPMLVDTASV